MTVTTVVVIGGMVGGAVVSSYPLAPLISSIITDCNHGGCDGWNGRRELWCPTSLSPLISSLKITVTTVVVIGGMVGGAVVSYFTLSTH